MFFRMLLYILFIFFGIWFRVFFIVLMLWVLFRCVIIREVYRNILFDFLMIFVIRLFLFWFCLWKFLMMVGESFVFMKVLIFFNDVVWLVCILFFSICFWFSNFFIWLLGWLVMRIFSGIVGLIFESIVIKVVSSCDWYLFKVLII